MAASGVRRAVSYVGLMVVFALAQPSTLSAQQETHGTAVLDLSGGVHRLKGGFFDYQNGGFFEVFAASAVRSSPRAAVVAGAGVSLIGGGFGDRCLVQPGRTGCAPTANFVATEVLAGVDVALSKASARVLIGPALYNGAGASSVGGQIRSDLFSPTFAHLGLGITGRVTWLPSHNGESLVAWAVGGSVAIR